MIDETINLLGMTVRDKITGIEGPVTSVCFDLYGCIQATIDRGYDKDGKKLDTYWLDIQRLEIMNSSHIIPVPAFNARPNIQPQTYDRGPAEKPTR